LNTLALYILSLILATFPPGKSKFSLESIPDCLGLPNVSCEAHPACPEGHTKCGSADELFCCPKPKWQACFSGGWNWRGEKELDECRPYAPDSVEGAWVRYETRAGGARRLEVVARALADVAASRGKDWPTGQDDLARALVSAFGWSTAFREDIQVGRTRGPGGEVCLADLQIKTIRQFVADAELLKLKDNELAFRFVGRDYDSLKLCFNTGATAFLNARSKAAWMCKKALDQPGNRYRPWEKNAFAMYGTGATCFTPPPLSWAEGKRYATLLKFRARKETKFPAWYALPSPKAS
jgi:hypothetical protein